MKKNSFSRRLAAFLMTFVMVLSLTNGFSAAKVHAADADDSNITFEKIENEGRGRLAASKQEAAEAAAPEFADDEMVRVSIVLTEAGTMAKGYEAATIETNTAAKSYRQSLKDQQAATAVKITNEVLGGETLNVVRSLTLAANIISAYVPYGKIKEIRTILGVKDVVIENRYEADASAEVTDPDMAVATDMTGTTAVWSAGYTGAGSTVAIVDTGLDTDHQSFSAEGFDYAISKLDKEVDLLTAEEVAAKWDQLNASEFVANVADTYVSSKVPYGVNYVDEDLDITHDNDEQGEHGSHVAGIAAANRYIPNADGSFDDALLTVKTQGVAPDAQLLIMKVFGKGGGAYDSDYMAAIEDAMVLGASSVNLSLGSSSAGMTFSTAYQDILDALAENNMVYTNSAGNNFDWTEANIGSGYMYADDVSYATGGSPGTYQNSLSVASVDNDGAIGMPMLLEDGTMVFYDDGASAENAPMTSIAKEEYYTYVAVTGTGDDFGDIPMEGKIAVCQRGDISFYVKANNAVAKGAVATVIYNNQSGTISMNLTGYTGTAPAVSITQADGHAMLLAGEKKTTENGYTYYEGKVKVTDTYQVGNYHSEYYTMSDFSSWGVPGNLTIKPEIATPGGNIWSVNGAVAGGQAYEVMSGTSMAAPHATGLAAVMAEYVRENGLEEKTGKTNRQLVQSLLMSTSRPLIEEASGNYYSVLKIGSGLADIKAATEATSFITMDPSATASAADGKVKAELGELARTADGKATFDVAFEVTNFTEENTQFDFDADFFTQDIWAGYGMEFRDTWTTPVDAAVVWTVDGKEYSNSEFINYDFDGNGAVNALDAQCLLELTSGAVDEISNEAYADIDADGDIDTYDAYLAFQALNKGGAVIEAGKTVKVNAHVTVNTPDNLFGEAYNGNYIEGYLYVNEADTEEGVIGVEHSIPVLGFYGNWTDASMFDRGSYLEYVYETEDYAPYMYYTKEVGEDALEVQGYLVQYAGDKNSYQFGGNPLQLDETYHPERNAINSNDAISGVQYTQIRNSAGGRFTATNAKGKVIKGSEKTYGPAYAAYYYRNGGVWRNTVTSTGIGFHATGMAEGTSFDLNYTLAPEYYRDDMGMIDWDALGKGATYSVPAVVDNTAPYIVNVAGNEEKTEITVKAHDNQYIAAVALFIEDGTLVNAYYGLEDILKGEQYSYVFDVSESEEAHYLVEVYDYAMNLSTYKLNFNEEELDDDVAVTVSLEKDYVLAGNTTKAIADVQPWGVDDTVFWSSADESIATIDDKGIVTAVAPGTTEIIATSAVDDEAFGSAEITVFTIPMLAYGVLQDEEGSPIFFGYDFESGSDYVPLGEVNASVTAAAYDWISENGQYYYQQDFDGYMHKIDIDTLETVEISKASTGFGAGMEDIDFPFLYNMTNGTSRVFGVAETYLLYSDSPLANTFSRGYDLASYLQKYTGATQFVAIAWAGVSAEDEDMLMALDDSGAIWVFYYDTEGGLSFGLASTDLELNYPVIEDTTGNSLIMGDDGELYLAHYNGSTSEFYQLAYDVDTGAFVNSRIADVGDDVWPAALLVVAEKNATDEGDAADLRASMIPAEAITMVAENVAEATDLSAAVKAEKADGGLEAVSSSRTPAADMDKISTDITASYATEKITTNGLVEVTYDPAAASVKKIEVYADHYSVNEEEGKITVAYVYDEAADIDTEVFKVVFESGSQGVAEFRTVQVNNEHPEDAVEEIILGSYSGPVWTWAEDGSEATAEFKSFINGEVTSLDADIVVLEFVDPTKDEDGYVLYQGSVEFKGRTFTDTYKVDLTAKFLAEISSDTENGTGAVTGYVLDDYSATLKITGTSVNTSNALVSIILKDVASLGIDGKRSFEKKFSFDSDKDVATSTIANLFKPLDGTTIIGKCADEEVVYKVEMTEDGYRYKAVPNAEEDASAVWHAIVNEDTVEASSKDVNDSYAIIANGSSLVVGNSSLEFESEDDLKLDNFNDLEALDKVIRGALVLKETEESSEDVVIYLKKGTELALGNSYAKLLKDAVITISGESIDTDALEEILKELRDTDLAADTTSVMKAMFKMLESVVSMIGGETVTVTVEFIDEAAHVRAYGETYYESSFVVANRLKAELGVDKFDAIVVARGTGESGFADALGGSYLAAKENAPILLIAGAEDEDEAEVRKAVEEYIAANLNKGGKVYILGGTAAISEDFETELKTAGVETMRFAGKNRWYTNIDILNYIGIEKGEEVIVVEANKTFADSLSAAAVGKPVFLVNGATETLRAEQKEYLEALKAKGVTFTVLGGEAAVIPAKYDLIASYGETRRIAGDDRYLTSVEVAKEYYENADTIVIFNGTNSNGYGDGLISGALAAAIKAPMILTRNNEKTTVQINEQYVGKLDLNKIYVIGNDEVVTDKTVLEITGLESVDDFVVYTE